MCADIVYYILPEEQEYKDKKYYESFRISRMKSGGPALEVGLWEFDLWELNLWEANVAQVRTDMQRLKGL